MRYLSNTFSRSMMISSTIGLVLACLSLSACSEDQGAESQSSTAQATNQSSNQASNQTATTNQSSNGAMDENSIRAQFSKIGLIVTHIEASPIDGLFTVMTPQGTFYSSGTGEQFVQGKLFGFNDKGGLVDYSAQQSAKQLVALEDEMIVFKAKNEQHVITVFTDITCGYCTKLHKELQSYLDKGITIRYLAFPRQGPRSSVAKDMAKIWCATDQKTALDKAKINQSFEFDSNKIAQCEDQVANHYQLGVALGVKGTPAIITADGSMIGGYLPADKMLAAIEGR